MITLLEFSGEYLCIYLPRKKSKIFSYIKCLKITWSSYFSTTKCGQNILFPAIMPLKLAGNKWEILSWTISRNINLYTTFLPNHYP